MGRYFSLLVWTWFVYAIAYPATGTMIDDFSVGPLNLAAGSNQTATQTNLNPSDVIGGTRFVTFEAYENHVPGGVQMAVVPEQHKFTYQADPGISAVNFQLGYGHTQSLNANLLTGAQMHLYLTLRRPSSTEMEERTATLTSQ